MDPLLQAKTNLRPPSSQSLPYVLSRHYTFSYFAPTKHLYPRSGMIWRMQEDGCLICPEKDGRKIEQEGVEGHFPIRMPGMRFLDKGD